MGRERRSGSGARRRGSLVREIGGMIIGLVAATVLLCWLLNTVFLERYYLRDKRRILESGYATIEEASAAGRLESDEFDVTFDNLCANGNFNIIIISADRTIVRSSANNNRELLYEFLDILFAGPPDSGDVLVQEDRYMILRKTDDRLSSEYLVLYGTLSDGNAILMRTALESIKESVKVANKLLLYIGILVLIFGGAVSFFVARRVTRPVLELTDISKRMAELDFDAKYDPGAGRTNEIDELGAHMNELSRTLERTISELKGANNQLLLDIEQKTRIDDMRKDFISNVSHELKTPLALIQGYAEGLKEGVSEDPESRGFYCDVILDETERMTRMVKKLLTLSQLESGRETISFERFDLAELVRGVLHSSEILLEQAGVTVSEVPDGPVYVWADEFMAEEVLGNYLSNAIHHAGGERRVAISCRQAGGVVRLCVFNTGSPIPDAEIDKIWDKFYKVDKARTREYGGSGIGLSIVKAVAEAFHRDCGVENRPDGVEFWFEFDAGVGAG